MGNNCCKLDCKDAEAMFDMNKKARKGAFGTKKWVAFKGIPDEYFDTSPFGDSPSENENDENEEVGERHNKENKRVVKKGKKMRVYNLKNFEIEVDHLHPEVKKAISICGPYDYSTKYLEQYEKAAKKGHSHKIKNREMWTVSITTDGSKYVGQFIKDTNIKDGIGYLIYPDGSIFEGTFRNDLPVKGRYIMINGDVYIGKMVNYIKKKEEEKVKFDDGDHTDDDTNISHKSWDVDDDHW